MDTHTMRTGSGFRMRKHRQMQNAGERPAPSVLNELLKLFFRKGLRRRKLRAFHIGADAAAERLPLRICQKIQKAHAAEHQAAFPHPGLQQKTHFPHAGIAVQAGHKGLHMLRQKHGAAAAHGPPLPVGVKLRGEFPEHRVIGIHAAAHEAFLLGKGAHGPEIRGELGPDGAGEMFLPSGGIQEHRLPLP